MDGQNFQNDQNGQNSNSNYQDYTANVQNQMPPVQNYGQQEPQKTNVLAIVGMVLGILAILVNCCIAYAFVGIILGIAGLVCSILSRKQGKSGMATAGIICSIIGILIAVALTILMAIGFAALQNPEFQDLMKQYGY